MRFHAQKPRAVSLCAGALFTLAGLLSGPTALSAQAGIRILPLVGLYAPLSELTQVRDGGASVFEAGKKSSTLALGLGLEVGGSTGGTSLRGHIGYATESEVPIGGLECETCGARMSLLTATVGAVLRPFPTLAILEPYLVVGGGVKRYDFDPGSLGEAESWSSVLRDQTRFSGQLGAGVDFSLLGLRPQLELSAHLSRFEPGEAPEGSEESDFQTDLFLMLAIPLGG